VPGAPENASWQQVLHVPALLTSPLTSFRLSTTQPHAAAACRNTFVSLAEILHSVCQQAKMVHLLRSGARTVIQGFVSLGETLEWSEGWLMICFICSFNYFSRIRHRPRDGWFVSKLPTVSWGKARLRDQVPVKSRTPWPFRWYRGYTVQVKELSDNTRRIFFDFSAQLRQLAGLAPSGWRSPACRGAPLELPTSRTHFNNAEVIIGSGNTR
jgi:hypothetical protein